jgi:uncharacterized membrane protein
MAERDCEGVNWLFKGLAVLFILVGLAAFISIILYAVRNPGLPAFASTGFGWGWAWNVIGLLVFAWVVLWLLRMLFHAGGWRGHGGGRREARRRYARGEISRKQYLEIIKDLDRTRE